MSAWRIETQDGRRGLCLQGDWRLEGLDKALQRAKGLAQERWDYLCLQDVDGVDSATLAFLLDWQAQQRDRGARGQILDAPPALGDLATLYGLEISWMTIRS